MAAEALRAWMDAGILRADDGPALYVYAQQFTLPDGTERTRTGVLCRLGLEEFETGVVRPHERTFPGPKADRLALLRATGAYLSPIFGLYARPGEPLQELTGVAGAAPDVRCEAPRGVTHRLWRVTDAEAIRRVQEALRDETIFIADGHHRYETALAYGRERQRAGGAGYVLACLANMEEEGLVILPTHRLVRVPFPLDVATFEARLAERFTVAPLDDGPRPAGTIDCVLPERRLRLTPGAGARASLSHLPPVVGDLDVSVLRSAILEGILDLGSAALAFTHDDADAVAAVSDGRATAAFLVNPPSMAAVRAVCLSGEVMPEKSTYFYPKLADGFVFDLVGPPWI